MIELIVGNEGTGKTSKLLEKVNTEVKDAKGSFVYLDKNQKHMFELNNKVRLIDVSPFDFDTFDEFYGFVCGIISQDYDIQKIYFDNFLKIGSVLDLYDALKKLKELGDKNKIDMVFSIAKDQSNIPADFKSSIIVAL